jgi:hypothetical protein
MVSSNSIDERTPENTTNVNLDEYNLLASKCIYTRAINKVLEWCKANTKVFYLSEYFGPGAEILTSSAEELS